MLLDSRVFQEISCLLSKLKPAALKLRDRSLNPEAQGLGLGGWQGGGGEGLAKLEAKAAACNTFSFPHLAPHCSYHLGLPS